MGMLAVAFERSWIWCWPAGIWVQVLGQLPAGPMGAKSWCWPAHGQGWGLGSYLWDLGEGLGLVLAHWCWGWVHGVLTVGPRWVPWCWCWPTGVWGCVLRWALELVLACP